jgi:putative ABC transport system substrate-binding protein
MKNRRAALGAIAALAIALGRTGGSGAQSNAKRALVGMLDASDRTDWWKAFRQQLADLGYVEGRNVTFEIRLAKGELELLPGMARELVRLKANVIATSGTSAALAAKRATTTIPIVMATGTDQVSLGLAASLSHPGGNVTGLSTLTSELMAKRFELMRELLPSLKRLAVLWHNENMSSMASVRDLEGVASKAKVALQTVGIGGPEDLVSAFSSMAQQRAEALIVVQTPLMFTERNVIAELALKNKLPSMYGAAEYVTSGGLMSYAPSYPELFRHAAVYVHKILNGANAGDLPIEQPSTFELVINKRTAEALGIVVAKSMFARASRVVE